MPLRSRLLGYLNGGVSFDLVAGITLAAYAIPVSLAYATLAGLPPQVGVYGYLMGGLGYALAGSSRFLAIGPTSAISLMIASTVSDMAGDDATRYAQIATLAAVGVAVICLLAWAFRLSVLVKLISDSVLTGFKAGAGLTIAITQLPALFGVAGGGHNVPERLFLLAQQIHATNLTTLVTGPDRVGFAGMRREVAARPTGCPWRRGFVDRRSRPASPEQQWRCCYRCNSSRTANTCFADGTLARPGRDRRTGRRLHAVGLYRGRGGCARICGEAR